MKENSKTRAGKKLGRTVKQDRQTRQSIRELEGFLATLGLHEASQSEDGSGTATVSGDSKSAWFIGIDLGDRSSRYCFIDGEGQLAAEGSFKTEEAEFERYFTGIGPSRIALEVGTHSAWVSALLEGCGHEVYVANPRKMESIHKNRRKNDKVDARTLARLVRADPELLYPIQHRGIEARQALVLLRARDGLVAVRSKLINSVRGLVKSMGRRLPQCSAESFHHHAAALPEGVRDALLPVMKQIESLTQAIRKYDRQVEATAVRYPETELLRQVNGVGGLTSLAYVLTVENPDRFAKSRDVGPYLGLVPRQDQSGDHSPQLRITKTGDKMVRRLLVTSAQYILGPFGEDCDLRRFGTQIAARGGKNAKKRAVVAVARKLAVMLHRLWVTAEEYEPLRNARMQEPVLEPGAKL